MTPYFQGWHPKNVKFEPASQEEKNAFHRFWEPYSQKYASSYVFWSIIMCNTHKLNVSESFKYILDSIAKIENPEHMTAMMTQAEIREFKILHMLCAPKEILATASKLLCLRERYMFASAFLKSLQEN